MGFVTDKQFMLQALELAYQGLGYTAPNPMVGAVLVRRSDVICTGFHKAYGEDHAEAALLKSVTQEGIEIEADDVLYVTLEPCNHYGKTPPCTEGIIEAGIKKVVVAMEDPNPLVSGSGIQRLRQAGVEVMVGLLEEASRALNKVFLKGIQTGLPHCKAKWAMTLDGKMAADSGDSAWISSLESRKLVHKWRAESDGVIVGIGTVLADDPLLTVRHVEGETPRRIVVDTGCDIPLNSKLLNDAFVHKTLVLVGQGASKNRIDAVRKKGATVEVVSQEGPSIQLESALRRLKEIGIHSLLSEAGPRLMSGFFEERLIDEVAVFVSPKLIGGRVHVAFSGIESDLMADARQLENMRIQTVGTDVLLTGILRKD